MLSTLSLTNLYQSSFHCRSVFATQAENKCVAASVFFTWRPYNAMICVFQFKKGGPIIAVQVENEYGSFAKDESYMLFIKEVM